MKAKRLFLLVTTTMTFFTASSYMHAKAPSDEPVSDKVIAKQHFNLAINTKGEGYGPQSPRDIDSKAGENRIKFGDAPTYQEMNLCNIHFHKNAEHKGGEFTSYAGNGDGQGWGTGYKYSGKLTKSEKASIKEDICPSNHGGLYPGDTIEVHYVHSSAQVAPGPTLGSCLSDKINNPQLRVEAQIFVLVNDDMAADFAELALHRQRTGFHQAINIPEDTGTPIEYMGSTTGPGYNEKGSPFQVHWSVRPEVKKVSIKSVGEWCEGNVFEEDHAHGVRNLITNPDLLSPIN